MLPHIAPVRWPAAFLLLVILDAVAGAVPLPRPRPPLRVEPRSFVEAAGPHFNTAEITSEPSECQLRLEQIASVEPMPRLIGPGACGGTDMMQLDAVQLPGGASIALKPAPLLRCEMAEALANWIREDAASQLAHGGAPPREVQTFDDYDCRGRNRMPGGKLSEHGKGNAIDLRAFTLADNRVLALTDIAAPADTRRALRESACARFSTVLGPGSDGYHESHIHLDLAQRRHGYRICQWDVREKPSAIASTKTAPEVARTTSDPTVRIAVDVPLPPVRPKIARARIKGGGKL